MDIDTTTVLIALAIVAGVLALYLVGAPMLVRLLFRKPAEPGFVEIQAEDALVPESVLDTFHVAHAALDPLGFVPVSHLRFDPEADLMDAYAMILAHPVNRDLAMVLDSVGPVGLHQIEFSTEFENGTEINTNNGPQLPLNVVIKPDKEVFWFPDIQDPAELYRAHAALCSARTSAAKKPIPAGYELLENIRKSMREDYEHAVQRGIFRFDPEDHAYTLTTTGAYRLTWPNMFPLSAVYKTRRRNQDRRALTRATGR